MLFSQLILRPISQRNSRFWSSVSLSSLFMDKNDSLNDVIRILEKSNPIEPALDSVVDILSPKIVSSVIKKQRHNPQLSFRFIIWAMKRDRWRIWKLHDLIVDMIKRDDEFELYWRTLEELKSSGVWIPSDAFLVLILSYWKVGIAEKAVESFGKMREFQCKPDVFTYNAILYIMVQKEVVLLALAVYNQMLKMNCNPNRATYGILIEGLFKIGKSQDALNLFDEMTQRGIAPNNVTYTVVLTGLCRAKRVHDAQILFDKMRSTGCSPDLITCNALLNGYCKLGSMDEAFMHLRSLESNGYALGLKGYSSLIDGLFRAGRFEEANQWFHRLCKENIKPDIALYTIMIRGFSQAGRVKDALKYLTEITERGLVPDTQCYNALIKGFCDMGLLEDARSLKLQISENDCFPDAFTHTILICGMCRNGLVGEAKRIFIEMEKLGCFPSIVTFNALIDALFKVGEAEEARLLFHRMEIGRNPSLFLRLSQGADRILDSASLQYMVERLCESGLFVKAYRILMQLTTVVVPNITTYNILINGMFKDGKIDHANKLFQKLLISGQCPDSVTYGTLMDGFCRFDKVDDALALLDQMNKSGISSTSAYISFMKWYCRKGKVFLACSLWLKYLRCFKNRGDEALKLIEQHFEKGELTQAVKDLLEMDFKLMQFDLAPYTIWLIGLCQARRIEEALKIFHVLQENKVDVTAPSCVMLIHGLCEAGKLGLALDVFMYTMEKGFILMPRICNKLLISLLRSQNNVKHAFDLLRKMELAGYNLNEHLSKTTKSLLHIRLNTMESVTRIQVTGPQQVASPGCFISMQMDPMGKIMDDQRESLCSG
ncbi:hypothetical protein Ancab_013830 [Ancistrocladus abbreviatus]